MSTSTVKSFDQKTGEGTVETESGSEVKLSQTDIDASGAETPQVGDQIEHTTKGVPGSTDSHATSVGNVASNGDAAPTYSSSQRDAAFDRSYESTKDK